MASSRILVSMAMGASGRVFGTLTLRLLWRGLLSGETPTGNSLIGHGRLWIERANPPSNMRSLFIAGSITRHKRRLAGISKTNIQSTVMHDAIISCIVQFFTALFGASAGAYAAYCFAIRQQKDTEQISDHRAATTAMFTLISRLSSVDNFRQKSMTESGGGLIPDRETGIICQYYPDTKLDFPSLCFMADTSDFLFLHELGISESHFFNFVEALRERNDHLHEILKSCEVHEFDMHTGKSVIGAKPIEMKLLADQNRNLVDWAVLALESTQKHIIAFLELLNRRFPHLPVFDPASFERKQETSNPVSEK